jgi:ATP-binding cassette subfamily F protein 3
MLRLDEVYKFYGRHEVLSGVTWAIRPGSRVGLVGPNGAGKSTILRLLAGIEEPDRGQVARPRGSEIGYLPQEGARLAQGTLLEAILTPFAHVREMEHELIRLHEVMATAGGEELERVTRESGEVQHRFEVAGGFELESRARAILTGLGFAADDHARALSEFSGGFRMRAALGALLLKSPDYILLDEPTNHLDLDGLAWLESYLQQVPSALVIVSHDRVFLNRLVGSIADLERGKAKVWTGNYDHFRREKLAARERAEATAIQEGRRRAEVERFIERFRYKATKARQVQSRIKMLEKMKATDVPPEDPEWNFRFPAVPRSAKRVLHLSDVRRSFDGRPVLRGVNLEIWRGERVALVGPNGCGKSTLLKIVAGLLPADAGHVDLGDSVILHYFAQHVLETLTAGRTLLEELAAWAPDRSQQELRSLLGMFQFSGDEAFKRVEVLSGGEKNRLAMARLMLDPGNFLLLDEPTNHLDLPSREALETALARFDGALLFVSHDRYFINRVATKVAGFHDGRLALYDGGYDDYRAALERGEREGSKAAPGKAHRPQAEEPAGRSATLENPAATPRGGAARAQRPTQERSPAPAVGHGRAAGGAAPALESASAGERLSGGTAGPGPRSREQKRAHAEARNERNRRLRPLREEVARLEREIEAAETKLKETDAALADPETYRIAGRARELGEAKKTLEIDLAHLYDEWEQATRALQQAEQETAAPA